MNPFNLITPRLEGFQAIPSTTRKYVTRLGRAFCPSCQHAKRKLDVAESSHDSALLLKCRMGCSIDEITQALSISTSDLFPRDIDRLSPPERNRVGFWQSASSAAEEVADLGFALSMAHPSELHERQIALDHAVMNFQKAARAAMRADSNIKDRSTK